MQFFDTAGLPELQAGAARVKITPPVGVGLAGYFHERVARRVRDELFCNAVVLKGQGDPIVLVSLDIIGVYSQLAEDAKRLIIEATGIPGANVLLHATHTHTGPIPTRDHILPHCAEWLDALPGRILEAVQAAMADLRPAMAIPGRETVRDAGSVRVCRQKNGHELFGRADSIGPAGPCDRELLALRLCDLQGETRAMVINHAMHPDTIGGSKADFISADWPGEICKNIAHVYGRDVVTVFLNGCCGDINHGIDHPTRRVRSGEARAVSMGRTLAAAAILATEQDEPMAANRTAARLEMLPIPYYTRTPEFLAEVEAARKAAEGWNSALVIMNDHWTHDGEVASVPVQVMRCGDVMFVGLPGEVFSRWALELKHWSPAPFTFVVELANGCFHYIPTTDQANRGAYGAKPILSRFLEADAGRKLADQAQVMLWELWE